MKKTDLRKRRAVTAVCAAAMMLGLASSCGSEEASGDGEKLTVSWWVPLFPHVSQTSTSFSETELFKELSERLNVEIEFIHPAAGQETENFNIMVAGGELPDLIERDFTSYKGGADKAIDDGVIISIDDYLDYAPNYKKILEDNPEWDKQVVTDAGEHYTFAWFRGDESLLCWQGPQIRKDLLDKAGLALPETIDEWDNVLHKFKEMGVEYPLSVQGRSFYFSGAYGVGDAYYLDDGKVKYGPAEAGYKDFVLQMKSWYDEGLLDPDFFAQNTSAYEAKITSGQVGAYFAAVGGGMGKYLPVLQELDPSIKLSGTKYPVLNKGDTPKFGQKDFAYYPTTSTSITTKCERVEDVVKMLDYGYSEEGHMLYNFGIEGVSYEMVDDYPKYTELITNNPDGLAMQYAMSRYMASAYGGPFVQDKRYFEQYMPYDEQKEAVEMWMQHDDNQRLPLITYTAEETNQISSLVTAIGTLSSENITKFIIGQKSMDEWDSFVDSLYQAGLNEVLQVRQNAVDRYNSR